MMIPPNNNNSSNFGCEAFICTDFLYFNIASEQSNMMDVQNVCSMATTAMYTIFVLFFIAGGESHGLELSSVLYCIVHVGSLQGIKPFSSVHNPTVCKDQVIL